MVCIFIANKYAESQSNGSKKRAQWRGRLNFFFADTTGNMNASLLK